MGVETFQYIDDLVSTNPTATDNVSEGDDHIRGIKTTLKNTFPNVTGAITPTETELNYVDGVTSNIQTQLDAKGTVSSLSDLSITATSTEINLLDGVTATTTELNYVDGVTSNVQTQLDAKYGSGDDATFDTITVDDGIKEKLQTKSITSTGTFTFQCASGQIFYVSSPAGNWTANFTDLTIASNYATTTTIVIVQGSTAYLPTGIAIGGSSATINWQGGSAPTGTNNGIDVVTFSFLNVGGTYTVLGQLTDF